jgi:hypothetical protein
VFLKIAAFVLPLGFDTFAVAVLLGLRRMRPLRPAATFTFFEAVMPLVGLLIGRLVGARFETPAVVVGGIVLLGVAIYMFKEALEQEEEAETCLSSAPPSLALRAASQWTVLRLSRQRMAGRGQHNGGRRAHSCRLRSSLSLTRPSPEVTRWLIS